MEQNFCKFLGNRSRDKDFQGKKLKKQIQDLNTCSSKTNYRRKTALSFKPREDAVLVSTFKTFEFRIFFFFLSYLLFFLSITK